MNDLIEKLEKVREGSPHLDVLCAFAIGWIARPSPIGQGYLYYPSADSRNKVVPHYTTFLDAALTLVPEGAVWAVSCGDAFSGFRATVMPKTASGDPTAYAATSALALCIASLKAREANVK